jgi:propanol-preferring alcohol dehydrogenase
MILSRAGAGNVIAIERDIPIALPGEVLVKVRACGVCRTDLHLVDGELPHADILAYTCGACEDGTSGRENLCANARFTGYQLDGGYAEYLVIDARYAFKVPDAYSDAEAAPLMCAGLIGYRAYRMTSGAKRLGLYGFGAAAHILTQVAVNDGREVYAFTSPGDDGAQALAREVGARWAGASTEAPPATLDAAIIFAPVGSPRRAGRTRRVRRHSHERHPVFPVSPALGRARRSVRCEPFTAGCRRVSGACCQIPHQDSRDHVSAPGRKSCAEGSAGR